jgi:hypothetical protein
LDGEHFVDAEEEVGVAAEFDEFGLGEAADTDGAEGEGVVVAVREGGGGPGAGDDLVDDGVGEGLGRGGESGVRGKSEEVEAGAGGDGGVDVEEGAEAFADGLGGGVHDTGEGVNLDGGGVGGSRGGAWGGGFDDRVGEEAGHGAGELGLCEGGFDEVDAGGGDRRGVEAEIAGATEGVGGAGIVAVGVEADLDTGDGGGGGGHGGW